MPKPLRRDRPRRRGPVTPVFWLALTAGTAAAAPGLAADGLTAYRGQDWAHLQATLEQQTVWLGPERAVELPATETAGASVRYDDLVLLGRDSEGAQEWAVAGVAGGRNGPRLRLYRGRERAVSVLTPPERPRAAIQIASVRCLTGNGPEPLHGLAWLEATRPRTQEVWVSPYRDGRFEPAVSVVGAGPGSQTALDAAVLADGSWLLVWSAFDGVDDELVWRLQQADGSWTGGLVSADNRVPDIAPRLLVTAEGAAVAWSRFDGRVYRVRTARFEQGSWRGEGWAAAPDSLYPDWVGDNGSLLFLRGATRAWTVAGPTSTVQFAAATHAPPVVDRDPVSGLLRARWPDDAGWQSVVGTPPGVAP